MRVTPRRAQSACHQEDPPRSFGPLPGPLQRRDPHRAAIAGKPQQPVVNTVPRRGPQRFRRLR